MPVRPRAASAMSPIVPVSRPAAESSPASRPYEDARLSTKRVAGPGVTAMTSATGTYSAIALSDPFALIVRVAPAREPQLDLGHAVAKVEAERHQRVSALLNAGAQAHDLPLVQEQLPGPHRIVVLDVALLVRADVKVQQPRLAAVDPRERVAEDHVSRPQRFHFRPGQRDPGLVRLLDPVLMPRAPVRRDDAEIPVAVLLRHASPAPREHPARLGETRAVRKRQGRLRGEEAAPLARRPRGHDQPLSDRRFATVPDLEPRGHSLAPAHMKQVGHRVVERRGDDAAVEHALVSLIVRTGRELGTDPLPVRLEPQAKADRIGLAAREAGAGVARRRRIPT